MIVFTATSAATTHSSNSKKCTKSASTARSFLMVLLDARMNVCANLFLVKKAFIPAAALFILWTHCLPTTSF